jgi:hypothetical protein
MGWRRRPQDDPAGDLTNEPALGWRHQPSPQDPPSISPASEVPGTDASARRPEVDRLHEEPALAWRSDLAHPDTSELYQRWRRTHPVRKWSATALAAVVSGPFAVLAALWQNSTVGFSVLIVVVVLAPVIEEVVKGAGALWLAEMRPWLVPTAIVLPVVTLMSGLVFAALENVWYLVILIEDPSDELIRWRWTFGPLLHGTASFIVGLGAARLWRSGLRSGRPDFGDALPFIVAAAVLHGGYNLVAVILSVTGVGPDA